MCYVEQLLALLASHQLGHSSYVMSKRIRRVSSPECKFLPCGHRIASISHHFQQSSSLSSSSSVPLATAAHASNIAANFAISPILSSPFRDMSRVPSTPIFYRSIPVQLGSAIKRHQGDLNPEISLLCLRGNY